LELVFAHLPPVDRRRYVAEYERVADIGDDGVWIVRQGPRVSAAVLLQTQPGRTALLHIPQGDVDLSLVGLLSGLASQLQKGGTQLVQTLLAAQPGGETVALEQAGFTHAANLLYLVSTRQAFPAMKPRGELSYSTFDDQDQDRLSHIIERTYVGSLDCPQLEALRDVDDVLAGYRSVGGFDPSRWLIARHHGTDVGCLLLAEHEGAGQWELTYLGVVPEARSRGFGLELVRQAQWMAFRAGCERIVLAVDKNNRPALDVYSAAGFVAWDERRVYLLMDRPIARRSE
jgi:ribosomal protein S18 acetylase RimI-like enzyme